MMQGRILDKNKVDRRKSVIRWCVIGILLALATVLLLWKPPAGGDAFPKASLSPMPKPSPSSALTDERTVRERAYDQDVEALRELIGKQDTDQAVRDQAAARLNRMVENHQTELAIEEALTQAGFRPCFVVMQNDALTVNLMGAELPGNDGVTVLSICVAHSDVAVENIRIMTRSR